MDLNAEKLCKSHWPDAFSRFTESVLSLKYDEEPKYAAYMALFKPLTGVEASRPIDIHPDSSLTPKKVLLPADPPAMSFLVLHPEHGPHTKRKSSNHCPLASGHRMLLAVSAARCSCGMCFDLWKAMTLQKS
jgi:hypothetical protein